jgi:hypothetical protein
MAEYLKELISQGLLVASSYSARYASGRVRTYLQRLFISREGKQGTLSWQQDAVRTLAADKPFLEGIRNYARPSA